MAAAEDLLVVTAAASESAISFLGDAEGKLIKCCGPLQKQRGEYVGYDDVHCTLNSSGKFYWSASAECLLTPLTLNPKPLTLTETLNPNPEA